MNWVITSLSLFLFSSISFAEPVSVSSSGKRIAVVELYTSEGCSSCPPADTWLSSLVDRGFKSNLVVPLSFHVTYWDYIGWKDPYAQQRFEDRQRKLVYRSRQRTMYTPHLFLNGYAFRNRTDFASKLTKINQQESPIVIKAAAELMAEKIKLNVNLNGTDSRHKLNIVVFENSLSSDVSRGENAGRNLTHDYVVRDFIEKPASNKNFEMKIPIKADWKSKDLGLAIYIESDNDILQAVQLKL